jgi:hypothetical protein
MKILSCEARIKEVAASAEEFRLLLKIDMESTVKISLFMGKWYGEVFPSVLSLKGKAISLTHSYHENSLDALLKKMLKGTQEEIVLFRKGMARGLK